MGEIMGSEVNGTTTYIGSYINVYMSFSLVVCQKDNSFEVFFGDSGAQSPVFNFLRLDNDGVFRWNYFDEGVLKWIQLRAQREDSCTPACILHHADLMEFVVKMVQTLFVNARAQLEKRGLHPSSSIEMHPTSGKVATQHGTRHLE